MEAARRSRWLFYGLLAAMIASATSFDPRFAVAQEVEPEAAQRPAQTPPIDFVQLFHDGGAIGYVITFLSVFMVALMVEHLMTIRRGTMIPPGLPEEAHRLISSGQFKAAEELCKSKPSFLGYMLASALPEIGLGYPAVEKAMEDAAAEQSARLLRKIEYLSVIGSIATMLGLLGTVWGMILAFMEFERKANPQISELAPGVYKALVTTLQGLIVAIPANVAFAYFRNRIDELVAQTSLMAEHIFADYKRSKVGQRTAESAAPKPKTVRSVSDGATPP
jgi:biopolymer transport protein ExbB